MWKSVLYVVVTKGTRGGSIRSDRNCSVDDNDLHYRVRYLRYLQSSKRMMMSKRADEVSLNVYSGFRITS